MCSSDLGRRVGELDRPLLPRLERRIDRQDGGIREGQAITPAFDPMLAKLVVHGDTRDEAVHELQRALRAMVLLGVPTNIDYLARIARHSEFVAGHLHTGFLTLHASSLSPALRVEAAHAAALAALLADDDFRRAVFDVPELHAAIGNWQN